ncbi:adenylyl-sulfate kinase [Ktedonosporobacter rubrisoli]|nr:adenylyl-sulfate kinase [Ktedonosporobacter rubrisoli]
MSQPLHSQWSTWPGWSMISAMSAPGFTIWLTGLPGTGKSTLASLLQQALLARGYKVEIIDRYSLAVWLRRELHVLEDACKESSDRPGYDAFITYLCSLLSHNGVITISASVSPLRMARRYAREQLPRFIEVYLHCQDQVRDLRLQQQDRPSVIHEYLYQAPKSPELSIDTGAELPEQSALRLLEYLEQYGYIAPRWAEHRHEEQEIEIVKERLRALGYLE